MKAGRDWVKAGVTSLPGQPQQWPLPYEDGRASAPGIWKGSRWVDEADDRSSYQVTDLARGLALKVIVTETKHL
ncbi:hypothetical protein HO173_009205 [Letharia columbiana]|uniref:Uncharacterized protein n=1 Tax=Letharia columbiana TaxID=112416 RepID=A0A8H6L1Z1_9LECA|nr:uncharacterized protein HO173_009205 [Letharia columbiana]KAF6232537.1 hypothetical protein HO173_009205 [Letharia columbiana]